LAHLFKIRGIYATALTKLLVERGLRPTQCSDVLASRLGLNDEKRPYDATVIEKMDSQGIRIRGKKEAVVEVLRIIREEFEDAVIWHYRPPLNAIYLAVVKEEIDRGYKVDLGETVGILRTGRVLHDGEKILVCVSRPSLDDYCEVNERLTLVGDYARLIKGGHVTVSRHIRDPDKRAELMALAYSMKPEGWGVHWRSSAEYANEEELIEDLEKLKEEAKRVEQSKDLEAPRLIKEGEELVEIEFPATCKMKADEVRSEVVPTIKGHHYYRAWGHDYSIIVDFAEELISKGVNHDLISRYTWEYMMSYKPKEGDIVKIEHINLRGEMLELTPGRVVKRNSTQYVLRRTFRSKGRLDGLGVEKKPGDYAETMFIEGSWIVINSYFRHDTHELLGEYVNINTPVEVYPGKIRYVDLEVDVVRTRSGEVKVLDEDKLKWAFERGIISKKLFEKTINIVEKVRELLLEGEKAENLFKEIPITCYYD